MHPDDKSRMAGDVYSALRPMTTGESDRSVHEMAFEVVRMLTRRYDYSRRADADDPDPVVVDPEPEEPAKPRVDRSRPPKRGRSE